MFHIFLAFCLWVRGQDSELYRLTNCVTCCVFWFDLRPFLRQDREGIAGHISIPNWNQLEASKRQASAAEIAVDAIRRQ